MMSRPLAQVVPERLDVGRAREAAGHGDDGDRLVAGIIVTAATRDTRGIESVAGMPAQDIRQRGGGGMGEGQRTAIRCMPGSAL